MIKANPPVTPSPKPAAAAPGTVAETPLPQGLSLPNAAVVLLAVAVLYFGRDIFVPFALAVLLSFLLAPLVDRLRRAMLPRFAAVLVVVGAAAAVIVGISFLVGSQLIVLADNLPVYEKTIEHKIRSLRELAPGGGTIDRTATVIQQLGKDLTEATGGAPRPKPAADGTEKKEPVPVRVEAPEAKPIDIAQKLLSSALGPLGTAGLVIVFIVFVLLEPSDLRDRFIRLAGRDLHRTTEAMNEAASRVSRYLLMQLIVNATYGIPLGVGLYFIGVPGAPLWALLATMLRFIPYLGPVIAAFFPLALAFSVDPGWSMLLWSAALILVLELVSNNLVEPWLYGSSTGLTPVAIILSAIFWTLLWGPVGLILATPLTVCLVVMARYIPNLAFIEVLLGSEPPLSREERLYQRLLAGNIEEAIDIAETELKEKTQLAFYDEVGLPTLRMAENARRHGASAQDRQNVASGFQTMLKMLEEQHEGEGERDAEPAPQQSRWSGTPVLCVAGRSELDAAAAALVAEALHDRDIGARLAPASSITVDAIGQLELAGVEVVFVSYLSPTPRPYIRFVRRRLRARAPHVKMVVGLWNLGPEGDSAQQIAADEGADKAVTGILDAAQEIEALVGQADPALTPSIAVPYPQDEAARLEQLERSGILESSWRSHLDRVARRVADALQAPIGLVSLIDAEHQLWRGAAGLPQELERSRKEKREMSVCTHVVAGNAPLVVEDTARDARFSGNPFLRKHGMRFYAGVPLRTPSGHVIGSLCVIDTQPRKVSDREVKLLQVVADELMAEVLSWHEFVRAADNLHETPPEHLPPDSSDLEKSA